MIRLTLPETDFCQTPIGTGIALAHKYGDTGGVSITMYGDDAASQGQLYEAWNMAKLWNLPVVYICENNKHGTATVVPKHSVNSPFYTRSDIIPGIKVKLQRGNQKRVLSRGPRFPLSGWERCVPVFCVCYATLCNARPDVRRLMGRR